MRIFYDYEMTPYVPVLPAEGKPSSAALFEEAAGRPGFEGVRAVAKGLREAFGDDRVVFGIKTRPSGPFFEFYFYRHAGADLELPLACARLKGLLQLPSLRGLPDAFMWSFETEPDAPIPLRPDRLHVYLGTVRNKRRFGRSFAWDGASLELENDYSFYRLPEDREPLRRALKRCLGDRPGLPAESLLPLSPEDAKCVCLARKKRNGRLPPTANGLYFSGLRLEGFRTFLAAAGLGEGLRKAADEQGGRLDHLLYDVGFDFELEGRGLRIVKSGCYGVL